MNLDSNRDLVESLECADLLLVDGLDGALTALELPNYHIASISDLDLELSIVASCLEDGLIFHQVPLILV